MLGMTKMDSFLLDHHFFRCDSEPTIYAKKLGNHPVILILYVDDLIVIGSDHNLLTHVKSNLKNKFEMTTLGHLHYFVGLQVLQTKEGIFHHHYCKYVFDLLRHFHMDDCKPTSYPFQFEVKHTATCTTHDVDATLQYQLVGSLLYLNQIICILYTILLHSQSLWKLEKYRLGALFGLIGNQI